ncbi:MAG: hypothetical protein RBS99_14330 [Rhodospirillales bacterium]|jgi:hypothetical protein|nr:hypothetical protein [Rhodospirillales bacterium]
MAIEEAEDREPVSTGGLSGVFCDAAIDEERAYFIEAPDLRRVGPLTASHIAALIQYRYLKDGDVVWPEGSEEPIEVGLNRDRFVRRPPVHGYHDTVLAMLPAAVLTRLPRNIEWRRGLVKGVLGAMPDFCLSLFFLVAYLFPSWFDASLAAGAGYMVAIEVVALWGGFFLDAAYGSGRNRSSRVAFAAFFFLYYGGVILGIGLLGRAGIWPALYAVFSLLQRLPRIVRTLNPKHRRLALECVFRSLGEFAYSNLMFVVAFVGAVDVLGFSGHAPTQALPWLLFLYIYFFGQGVRRVFAGLFENTISEYVDYCVAYNMMGAVRKR